MDRELIVTYGALWITKDIFTPNFQFNHSIVSESGVHYQIPDCTEHARFLEYISSLPEKDNPLIFGLNPNADLTFRLKESVEMINTLVDTQPKEASGSGGMSREDEVKNKLEKELLPTLPADFNEADVKDKIATMRGPRGMSEVGSTVPLNVCLY